MGLKIVTLNQRNCSSVNIVVLTVFYCEGVVQHEFLIIDKDCYLEVTKRLRKAAR